MSQETIDVLEQKLGTVVEELRILRSKTSVDRIWDMAMKAAIPAVLAVIGWVMHMEVRLAIIESNRFTAQDAAKMKESLPPNWLRNDIKEIKDRLRRLEERRNEEKK